MNRRGSLFVLGVMFFFFMFIAIVILIEPLKDVTDIGRNALDCDNSSISTEEEMTCIAVGSTLPIFVLAGLGVALGLLGIRRLQVGGGGGAV